MSDSSSESVGDGSGISDWALVDGEGEVEDDSCSTSSVEVVDDVDDQIPTPVAGTSPQPYYVLRLSSCDPTNMESEDEATELDAMAEKSDSFDIIQDSGGQPAVSGDFKDHVTAAESDFHGNDLSRSLTSSAQADSSLTNSQIIKNEDIDSLVAAIDQVKSDLPLLLSRSTSRESAGDSTLSSMMFDFGPDDTTIKTDSLIGQDLVVTETEDLIGRQQTGGPAQDDGEQSIGDITVVEEETVTPDQSCTDLSDLPDGVPEEDLPSPPQETLSQTDEQSLESSVSSSFSFLTKVHAQERDKEDDPQAEDSLDVVDDTSMNCETTGSQHMDEADTNTSQSDTGSGNQTGDNTEEDDITGKQESGELLVVDQVLDRALLETPVTDLETNDLDASVPDLVARVVRYWRRESLIERIVFLLTLILSFILWTTVCINIGVSIGLARQTGDLRNVEQLLHECTSSRNHFEESVENFRQQMDLQHESYTKTYGTCRRLLYESDERNSDLWAKLTKLRYAKTSNVPDETFTDEEELGDIPKDEEPILKDIEDTEIEDEELDSIVDIEEEDETDITYTFEDVSSTLDDGSFPDVTEVKGQDGKPTYIDDDSATDVKDEDTKDKKSDTSDQPTSCSDQKQGEGSSCPWCFNELNKLREKWMKAETERETETARAQMWMHLYQEERESGARHGKKKDEKTLNLHNCWKYLTENFTGSSNFFKSFGMSWADIQNLWPNDILSTFENLLRSKQQQPSESPRSNQHSRHQTEDQSDTDWDTDSSFDWSDTDSGEKTGRQFEKDQSFWSETVNDMLNKTKTSVSTVNKQIQDTWKQVRNMSKSLWIKHKPALHDIQKSFTKKIEEVSKTFQKKLYKKSREWMNRAQKDDVRKKRAATKRRPHTSAGEAKNTCDNKQQRNENGCKGQKTNHNHGNKSPHQQEQQELIKNFRNLKRKIKSLNARKFMKMSWEQINMITKDLKVVFDEMRRLHPLEDKWQKVEPIFTTQQGDWLIAQLRWWNAAAGGREEVDWRDYDLYACWQVKVSFGEKKFRACQKERHSEVATDDTSDEEAEEIETVEDDWMTMRAKDRENLRRKMLSDDYLSNNIDWFIKRAENRDYQRGRFSSMSGNENSDWLYERGRERRYLRQMTEEDEEEEEFCLPGLQDCPTL